MTTISHASIADADRHEAKGASSASSGQVNKANGDGTTSYVDPVSLVNITMTNVLDVSDTTTQSPSATNTATEVKFGGATSNSHVTVSTAGDITFLQAGLYDVEFDLEVGRVANTGSVILLYQVQVNGTVILPTGYVELTDLKGVVPVRISFRRSFAVNDILNVFIMRDSTGLNDGSLTPFTPAGSFSTAPSAHCSINLINGGA